MHGLDWIREIGPSAAAIAVVVLFLRNLASERIHLSSEREVRAKQMVDRDNKIMRCVDRNSEVISKNTTVIGHNTEVLRRLNGQE